MNIKQLLGLLERNDIPVLRVEDYAPAGVVWVSDDLFVITNGIHKDYQVGDERERVDGATPLHHFELRRDLVAFVKSRL